MTARRGDAGGHWGRRPKASKERTRVGGRCVGPRALSYLGLGCRYNFKMTARILLNGEFVFCSIHKFNGLSLVKIAHKQLWRDETSRQSLNCMVRIDS
jgi:hypothetical protein